MFYCVEVKKSSESEGGWKEVYRGKDKKCSVSGLEKDTEYNVRVKCVVRELQGMWGEVTNFRTKNLSIDSVILSSEVNSEVFKEKLCEWCGTEDFELLYRGSRDGFGASDFHGFVTTKQRHLSLLRTQVDMFLMVLLQFLGQPRLLLINISRHQALPFHSHKYAWNPAHEIPS